MKEGLSSKYDMPVTLGNIQVEGGEDIKYTDYTYKVNSDLVSAYVVIPGKFITSNLTITSEAKLVQHELIFSKSKAFEVVDPIVEKNEALDTDINVIDEWKEYVNLPTTLEISIGGNPLTDKQFDYDILEEGVKAHLHIDAWLITDDIIVTSEVTPDHYTVAIKDAESNHLKINNSESTVVTDFNATISVTDEIYVLPKTLKITGIDDQGELPYEIPADGYYYSPNSGALTIYDEYVYGDITIEATAEQAECILEVESSEDDTELLFYKDSAFQERIEAPILIQTTPLETGYSIYVSVKNPTEPSSYIVPSTFDITVNGEKVVGYTVKYGGYPSPVEGDTRYATLTIQKDCVKGHVHVYGVAQEKNKHALIVKTAYLTTNKLPEYITEPQTIECSFTPTGMHDLPLAENVNVEIDGVWYDGNGYDEKGVKREGISYDETSGKLTISKGTISKIEKEDSDIVIIAKPADVSVLKELTATSNPNWETLHALSMYGYKLFTPGETTSDFYLDGYDYPFQARLIGFAQERGSTDTGYVQGLTLEFTTSISLVKYYKTTAESNVYYKKDYTGVFESNLYTVLNNASTGIVNRLPEGLKSNLYQVTKYGLTSDGANKLNSLNYLYPLSLSEMNEQVITTDLDEKYLKESANIKDVAYHYYKQFKTQEDLRKARIKGYQDKAAGSYWLRTPYLGDNKQDYYINGINNPAIQGLARTASQTDKGIAPAFCI